MSDADPALSFEEAMKRELSRYRSVILEREKMERDSLKKEVEELRLKMMESHQTSPFDNSILQDLEQALQTMRKANAALAGAPRVGSSSKVTFPHSSKGSSAVDVGTEEAAKNSVFAQTKQYNQLPNLEAGGQSKKDNQGETPQEVKEGGQRKPDNQGKNSHEVEEGGSSAVDVGTEEAAKKSVFTQTKQYNQLPNLEAGGQSKKDNQGETPQEVKEEGQCKPDNQGKNSHEVEEGGSSAVDVGTEEAAKNSVFAQTKQYNQLPNLEAGGQSKKDNQGETPQEVKEEGQRKPDNQGKNSHEVEEGGSSAVDVGTEEAAKKSVFAQTKQYNQLPNLEAGAAGRTAADRFRPTEAYNSGTVIEKQVDRDGTPEARDMVFKLIRCCDLNLINQIKKHLRSENLERFEKSCFGHFLNLNHHLEYQGNVLLHLMMHLDMAASSNEKLVFRIKNSVVEFRPRDFSLITGLRLGELGPMIEMSSPSSSSILRDAFKNRSIIFVKNIKAAFLNVSRVNKGSGELALKLAMLYFLHGNLLSHNPFKKIDLKYFTLVEDLDRFDEFPWGQLAFEFLASFMLSTRRRMDFSNASHRRLPDQCMLGFSFALQVWAYETMPSLAEFCEARVVNPETAPTILRWSALKRLVRFESLKVFFETDQGPSSMVQGIRASPMEAKRRPRETSIRRVKEEQDKVCDAAKPSPSTAAGEVITISDDEDDDGNENRRKRKRNEEAQQASAPAL